MGMIFFVAGALSLPHCSDVVGCGAGLLLSLVLPLSMLQGKGLVWIAAVLYNLLHATPWVSWCLPCSSSGVVHCRHTWWTGRSRIGTAITTGHGCISIFVCMRESILPSMINFFITLIKSGSFDCVLTFPKKCKVWDILNRVQ